MNPIDLGKEGWGTLEEWCKGRLAGAAVRGREGVKKTAIRCLREPIKRERLKAGRDHMEDSL